MGFLNLGDWLNSDTFIYIITEVKSGLTSALDMLNFLSATQVPQKWSPNLAYYLPYYLASRWFFQIEFHEKQGSHFSL